MVSEYNLLDINNSEEYLDFKKALKLFYENRG
jgi:hypothetical protein